MVNPQQAPGNARFKKRSENYMVPCVDPYNRNRAPTTADIKDPATGRLYPIHCEWRDNSTNDIYKLVDISNNSANWQVISALATDTAMANFIVDPNDIKAEYTTIQPAIDAASSGDTVGLKPGTYNENIIGKAGVNIVSLPGEGATGQVTIKGKISCSFAGAISISGIRLETDGDYCLEVTGSSATVVNLDDCYLNAPDFSVINSTSTSSGVLINVNNCRGDLLTTGINYFNIVAGNIRLRFCDMRNDGSSTTNSTIGAGGTGGVCNLNFSLFLNGINTSGTAALNCTLSNFFGAGATFNLDGSGSHFFLSCRINTGTNTCLALGASNATRIQDCLLSSSTTVITGAGTLNYSNLSFENNSTITAATQNILNVGPNANYSGTSHIKLPTGTTGERPGTPLDGMVRYNTTLDTYEGYDATAADWTSFAGGDVVGPASSTDNALARFDTTTGKLLQDSTVLVTDDGMMTNASQPAFLAVLSANDNNVTGNNTTFTVGSGNPFTIIYDQSDTRAQDDFTTTGTFTAPVTGRYYLHFASRMTSTSGTTDWIVNIVTSNRTYQMRDTPGTSKVSLSYGIVTIADMTIGDTATFNITLNGIGADTADLIASSNQTRVAGALIC